MLNQVPVPSSPIDPYSYLLHQSMINKLLIIENEFILSDKYNQNPPYTYDEIMKILQANYVPGDFNCIPFIHDNSTLQEAFRNAHRAQSNPNAPYYSCMCNECKRTNLVFTKRDMDLYSKMHYIPQYCPKCLSSILSS